MADRFASIAAARRRRGNNSDPGMANIRNTSSPVILTMAVEVGTRLTRAG
jgi:hypothetical protein